MAKQKKENPFGGVSTTPTSGNAASGPNSTFNAAIDMVRSQIGVQDVQSPPATPEKEPQVVRVNRGYKLREDLIKECKRIAIDDEKHLYDVMEEALVAYIEKRRGQPAQ